MSRKIRVHRDPFEEQGEPTSPSKSYGPVRSLTEEEERSQRRRKEDGSYWAHVNGWD